MNNVCIIIEKHNKITLNKTQKTKEKMISLPYKFL